MITPLEIQKKEFKKSLSGYNPKSVESFLDEILVDYEVIYKENIELKDKINFMADQIRHYQTLEETLNKTLIVAQKTADEVTSAARQKADNIVDDAELRGQDIINQAKDDVRDIKTEYENLKKEIFIFKTRYESFLEAQLLSLNEFYNNTDDNQTEEIEEIEETTLIDDSDEIEA